MLILKEGDRGLIDGVVHSVQHVAEWGFLVDPILWKKGSQTLQLTKEGKLHPDANRIVWESLPQVIRVWCNIYQGEFGPVVVSHETPERAENSAVADALEVAVPFIREE